MLFHYMPVNFDYGYDSRVKTNFSVGTDPEAQPFKIVMDTGSSEFWESLISYDRESRIIIYITDIATRGKFQIWLAISLRIGSL